MTRLALLALLALLAGPAHAGWLGLPRHLAESAPASLATRTCTMAPLAVAEEWEV